MVLNLIANNIIPAAPTGKEWDTVTQWGQACDIAIPTDSDVHLSREALDQRGGQLNGLTTLTAPEEHVTSRHCQLDLPMTSKHA